MLEQVSVKPPYFVCRIDCVDVFWKALKEAFCILLNNRINLWVLILLFGFLIILLGLLITVFLLFIFFTLEFVLAILINELVNIAVDLSIFGAIFLS